jgi:cation:H+ antiporter
MLHEVLLLIVGLVFLLKGADWVTKYASKLAVEWGISEFSVGMTLVAATTSLPEITVAALAGITTLVDPATSAVNIASGTVIGSNIANIGLILGLVVIFRTMVSSRQYMNQQVFMMLLTGALALVLLLGMNYIGGLALIGIIAAYVVYLAKRRKPLAPAAGIRGFVRRMVTRRTLWDLFLCFVGGAIIVIGATLLIDSVVRISEMLAISKFMISLVVVALGTSLPELSASLVAALRGMRAISIGNIIGSNIFNILALALASLAATVPLREQMVYLDLPILLVITFMLTIFMYTRENLTKYEGGILLLVYAVFIAAQFI